MKANIGDRIVLAPVTVDAPMRDGEVLETRGPGGAPPFLIRWSDGHTGLFYPGPGAILSLGTGHPDDVVEAPPLEAAPTAEEGHDAPVRGAEAASRRRVHDWQVRVTIFESDDETHANVVLLSDSPAHLTARGESTRGPDDQPVPEIGDEIAVARALRHLADRLIEVATGDIETLTGEHDVRVRAT
ncbi:dsRBD fold-containing protein [Intrasporangium sp. YIM S08009]|uniref:dsRBD fold-containing protein n=1 Tax=Intrasporangium zincisolvens TaxID=3080018 RepID=UPI002B0582B6|nr:dsRBD fold-containing protein [Intrasporangium sp. YIM S08009]